MRVLSDLSSLPAFVRPVVTVGSFDGVHRGHRFLLDLLVERARELNGETVVITFGDHPRVVLGADEGMRVLTATDEKAALLAGAGVENLVVMPFTAQVAAMSAEEFVREVLVGLIGVRELVVGYNHRLGRGREGGAEELEALGAKYGFSVFRAPRLAEGDSKISSTSIRRALDCGDIAAAERMLGRKIGIDNLKM